MKPEPPTLSEDDLLTLLPCGPDAPAGAMSTNEIAEARGRSRAWVQERIHALARAGKVDVAWRDAISITGARYKIPVYYRARQEN